MTTVYFFQLWDQFTGDFVIQPRKSPADRIKEYGGTIIPGTAEEVPTSALDAHGRYNPKRQS